MPSFLEELRAEQEHARRRARKVLAIPGSSFAVRFKPPERAKLDGFLAAYRANAVTADDELQFIIDCHDEVVRRSDNGTPLDESPAVDPDNGALRFDGSDGRWGLGEHGSARQAVAALYNLEVHPFAAAGHVEALTAWLQGLEAELARGTEGNSQNGAA